MSEELKACPFCNQPFEVVHSGGEGVYDGVLIKHDSNIDCPIRMDGENGYIYAQEDLVKALNTRPIEDALRARIAELEASDKYDTELTEKRLDEEATLWKRIVERRDTRIAELEDAARWIPVSERLPEYNILVFAIDKYNGTNTAKLVLISELQSDMNTVPIMQWEMDGCYFHDNEFSRVTHWMPLPKLPQDGDK